MQNAHCIVARGTRRERPQANLFFHRSPGQDVTWVFLSHSQHAAPLFVNIYPASLFVQASDCSAAGVKMLGLLCRSPQVSPQLFLLGFGWNWPTGSVECKFHVNRQYAARHHHTKSQRVCGQCMDEMSDYHPPLQTTGVTGLGHPSCLKINKNNKQLTVR